MTELANMLIEDEKIQIAGKLLKRGISTSAIAEDTGLDISIIQELQEEMQLDLGNQ